MSRIKFLFVAFSLLLLPGVLQAQTFHIDDIPLKWKDFTIKRDFRKHPFSARIFTQMPFRWETKTEKGVIRLSIFIRVEVDREKSWVKEEFMEKSTDEAKKALLNHEKGHYIIAFIHYKKFQKLLQEHTFSKRMKPEMDSLYTTVLAEMNAMNTRYDDETDHIKNTEKQSAWQEQLMAEFNKWYADEKKISRECEINKLIAP